jgi:non-homologous end joining protein Ku
MVAGNDWGRGVRVWKECNSLVKYLNTCAERKSAGIVNGYGHQKGRFVLVDLNDADKLRAKTDHVIGIDGFTSVAASDFSTSNYLERNSRDQLLARVFRGFVFGGQS